MKLEFKKALVPISFFYFFLFLSFNFIFPYFTLQMLTLGLNLDDAALIGWSLFTNICLAYHNLWVVVRKVSFILPVWPFRRGSVFQVLHNYGRIIKIVLKSQSDPNCFPSQMWDKKKLSLSPR